MSTTTYARPSRPCAGVLPPSFSLPSRHTLSRIGPELLLSLAAVGALYRFEHAKGVGLYQTARSLINLRLDQMHRGPVLRYTSTSPMCTGFSQFSHEGASQGLANGINNAPSPILSHGQKGIRLLQGLLVLMAITSWGEKEFVRDALSMASQVAMLVRELGIGTPEDAPTRDLGWQDWIDKEGRRRTLFVAYVLFSLQCTAFNVPPMILNQEVLINLPASSAEWNAPSELEWSKQHHAFGNYVLIHGLFLQIFFARNARSLSPQSYEPLEPDFVQEHGGSLASLARFLGSDHLLRLIYVRLNANIGPCRQLLTRDPSAIAQAFVDGRISVCIRSPHLDRAILQCIHALSIPVRVGIAFVARTLTLNWSFQHALSNLECAFLLTHWLGVIASYVESSGINMLRSDEQKLLRMLAALVRETEYGDSLDSLGDDASRVRNLAACVTRIWAETFKGFQVFEIVYVVGRSLSMVADILERDATSRLNGI
ncbi:unnamed protein product [Clonostachys rosea f. rosea IK726]|uniref:Uncharacterized protein n=2 Tax=Clonostachys rosea f. rosea IK726 TaxID=1349383 RepID=A0ACA9UR09_BIOOC|nr:unnamed protein product [Clonostachys rosea f. rosea IK726]